MNTVVKDDLFPACRQVKRQPVGIDSPYHLANWLVAFIVSPPEKMAHVSYLHDDGKPDYYTRNTVRRVVPATAEHTAFVRGSMPPFVYADWLEEQGIDLTPEAFALLRSGAGT